MEAWAEAALALLSSSGPVRGLVAAVPVAIAVAALAGWRQRVEGAGALALFSIAFCVWLVLPWRPAYTELQQTSLVFSILCWLWLVWAWGRHVLGDWPAPIWGHWIVGTLLWILPVVSILTLILG
jgi:hypothetical protein